MARVILTFETLHKVLAADKALRADRSSAFKCRPTPTPPGLSEAICGMSIELLEPARKEELRQFLDKIGLPPKGVHEVA
jgi:hypothetical protein